MILDRIRPISIAEADREQDAMALRTLQVLAHGLSHLYHCVRGVELQVADRLGTQNGPDQRAFVYGDSEELNGVPLDLVECAFRWYSVSLCDFVRAVVFLGKLDDQSREQYSIDVAGPVQTYRDKVAAHTVGFTRNRRDNDAERSISPCSTLAWNGDRFEIGTFSIRVCRGDKTSDSGAMQPWSLTEVHLRLRVRYPMLDNLKSSFSSPGESSST